MTLRTLLVVDAVLAFVSALALLVIPGQFVAPFGAALDPTGTFTAQGWGTSLLGLGVASWVVRDAGAPARRSVAIADAVEWFATAALFAIGITSGTVNTLAAIWVVIGVLFGAAFVGAVAGIVFRDSGSTQLDVSPAPSSAVAMGDPLIVADEPDGRPSWPSRQ